MFLLKAEAPFGFKQVLTFSGTESVWMDVFLCQLLKAGASWEARGWIKSLFCILVEFEVALRGCNTNICFISVHVQTPVCC